MTFEGFVPPVDDFFRMPNAWINICAEIDSLSELKVVQYVLRHTWGYQGFSGARKITIDEFMHGRKRKDGSRIDNGTGLSKQSVITAVGAAIVHGYLTCDRDDKDMARQKKYYQLAMKSDVKMLDSNPDVKELDIQSDVKNLDPQDVKELDPDVKTLDSDGQEFRQRSEKDTIERHLGKTLERQGLSSDDDTPAENVTPYEKLQKRITDNNLKAVVSSDSHADIGNEEPHRYTYAELAVRNLQLEKEIDEMERAEAERNIVDSTIEDISLQETQQRLPAVPKQTPAAGAAIPPSSGAGVQAPSPISNSTPEQRSGASPAGIPASPGAAQARQVIPKRPLHKVIEKPQLTFGGQQVREWYEQARECKVRMTDKNVITLNRLADIDEMTQENLRDVLELYDTDKWLIDHNVTVDLQELEKQDGKFTFERGLLAVKRKRRAKGTANNISKNGTDLNQYGLQALLQRQEQKAV